MAIEITGRANAPKLIKPTPNTGVEGEKKFASTNNTEKDDSVELTTATQEIKKAFVSSSAVPLDINRVNALKKALAEQSYPINAEEIAKKLIQFEKLMPHENST